MTELPNFMIFTWAVLAASVASTMMVMAFSMSVQKRLFHIIDGLQKLVQEIKSPRGTIIETVTWTSNTGASQEPKPEASSASNLAAPICGGPHDCPCGGEGDITFCQMDEKGTPTFSLKCPSCGNEWTSNS